MPYYFSAQIKINNKIEYQHYKDGVDEIFKKFNGEYLAIDDNPIVIEGKLDYYRSVLIKFNSKTDFENWYYSDEYQEILKYRLNGAQCDTILIKGLNDE